MHLFFFLDSLMQFNSFAFRGLRRRGQVDASLGHRRGQDGTAMPHEAFHRGGQPHPGALVQGQQHHACLQVSWVDSNAEHCWLTHYCLKHFTPKI